MSNRVRPLPAVVLPWLSVAAIFGAWACDDRPVDEHALRDEELDDEPDDELDHDDEVQDIAVREDEAAHEHHGPVAPGGLASPGGPMETPVGCSWNGTSGMFNGIGTKGQTVMCPAGQHMWSGSCNIVNHPQHTWLTGGLPTGIPSDHWTCYAYHNSVDGPMQLEARALCCP